MRGAVLLPAIVVWPRPIENRIAEVLDAKRRLFEEVLSQNGPPARLGLNENEIFGLFDIRHRPKRAA